MRYDISKATAPAMPTLGKGTECIRLLLSQTSKDMHEPLVPMLFPILGAHISGAEFQYPDLTWKELCGQMANLVAESGGNKGQLSLLIEALGGRRVTLFPDSGCYEKWSKQMLLTTGIDYNVSPRLLRAPALPEGTSCPACSVRTAREVPSDGAGRGSG